MNATVLEKAYKIKCEIEELEKFLYYAENVWTGKLVKRTSKFILKSNPFGTFNEAEYWLDTKMKNKVLDVLRSHLDELHKEMESI